MGWLFFQSKRKHSKASLARPIFFDFSDHNFFIKLSKSHFMFCFGIELRFFGDKKKVNFSFLCEKFGRVSIFPLLPTTSTLSMIYSYYPSQERPFSRCTICGQDTTRHWNACIHTFTYLHSWPQSMITKDYSHVHWPTKMVSKQNGFNVLIL